MLAFSGHMLAGSSGWYGHSSLVVYGAFWLFSFEQLYVRKNPFFFPLAVVLMSATSIFYIYTFTVFLFLYALIRFSCDNRAPADGVDSPSAEEGSKPPDGEHQGETPDLPPLKPPLNDIASGSVFAQSFAGLMGKLAGLGALGLTMNAVFIINPLTTMLNSPRVGGEVGYAGKLASHPVFELADPLEYLTALARCFSTDILGGGAMYSSGGKLIQSYHGWGNHFESPLFYCSLPALLLLPQLFHFLNKRRKILLGAFMLFWVALVVFPFFRYAFYLFTGNYYKGGLNFFIPALLIWSSMWALNEIQTRAEINLKLLAFTLVVLALALCHLLFSPIKHIIDKTILAVALGLLPVYALLIAAMVKKHQRFWPKAAFFALLLAELAFSSNATINHRNPLTSRDYASKLGYNDYTIEALEYIKSIDSGFYRVEKEYVGKPIVHINMNDSQAQGFYGTPSYNSFNQKYYISFLAGADLLDPAKEWQTRCSRGVSGCPVMRSFSSVKYLLSKKPLDNAGVYGYELIHKTGDVLIYKNKYSLPFGFTCDGWMTESDYKTLDDRQKAFAMLKAFTIPDADKNVVDSMRKLKAKDIPKRYKLSEYARDVETLRKHHLRITSFTPTRITGTISLPNTRMMIFSTPYDKGWNATVDGNQTNTLIVDFGLLGVMLREGTHEFVLNYRQPYIQYALLISILGILLYISLFLLKSDLLANSRKQNIKTGFKQ